MKKLFCLIAFVITGMNGFSAELPDSTLNLIDKGIIANKLIQVRDKYIAGDYRGALQLSREVLTEDKDNATAHYRMAECYLKINEYGLGMVSLEKALASNPKINKESDYLMAMLAHRLGQLDKAKEALARLKPTLTEKELIDMEIDLMEQQIQTAIEKMKNPVNVTIKEMGENINGHQDDYSPLLSPDGKVFYFVSRRPSSTGSNVAGDYKYYEDIYTSVVDESGNWQKAEKLDAKVNTDEFDNLNYISKDGNIMYLTYNIEGFTKSSDLAVAKMSRSGKWNMGKLLKKANSTYFDACPTLPDAMDQMYFVSERPGGKGSSDMWKVTMSNGNVVGVPVNVSSLNTPYNETTPYISADGMTMFFSSEGHGSMGGYDIFMSRFQEGSWSTPINLGYPINTVDDETHFKISADGKKAYFSSIRKDGSGGRDIYELDLSNFDLKSLK